MHATVQKSCGLCQDSSVHYVTSDQNWQETSLCLNPLYSAWIEVSMTGFINCLSFDFSY